MLKEVYGRVADVERVNTVVSEEQGVTRQLQSVMEAIRVFLRTEKPEVANLLGDLIPASMKEHLPLQAADLLCWHLQRYYSGVFDRVDESRMWSLLKERNGELHEWSREDVQTLASRLGSLTLMTSVKVV